MEILLYNLIFWPIWLMISMFPQQVMRAIIEDSEYFLKKDEKDA